MRCHSFSARLASFAPLALLVLLLGCGSRTAGEGLPLSDPKVRNTTSEPCSVVDLGNGTAQVICPDGTSLVVGIPDELSTTLTPSTGGTSSEPSDTGEPGGATNTNNDSCTATELDGNQWLLDCDGETFVVSRRDVVRFLAKTSYRLELHSVDGLEITSQEVGQELEDQHWGTALSHPGGFSYTGRKAGEVWVNPWVRYWVDMSIPELPEVSRFNPDVKNPGTRAPNGGASANGRWLGYWGTYSGSYNTTQLNLTRMGDHGPEAHFVIAQSVPEVYEHFFSADGETLAYIAVDTDYRRGAYVSRLSSGVPTTPVRVSDPSHDSVEPNDMALSPNGSKLLYSVWAERDQVYLVSIDTPGQSPPVPIHEWANDHLYPWKAFSSNSKLCFVNDYDELYWCDASGTLPGPLNIVHEGHGADSVIVSSNRPVLDHLVYYLLYGSGEHLFAVDIEDESVGAPIPVIYSPTRNFNIRHTKWADSRLYMTVDLEESGRYGLYRVSAPDWIPQKLLRDLEPDEELESRLEVSKDGSAVMFRGVLDGEERLYAVRIKAGIPQPHEAISPLLDKDTSVDDWMLSPDGEHALYRVKGEGYGTVKNVIYFVDMETSPPTVLPALNAYGAQVRLPWL